ncbi:TRAP transporter large permease [Amorphus sp. MBR-141]
MMDWYMAGLFLVGTVLILMSTSLPVAFAFILTNIVGVMVFIGPEAGLKQLVANATTAVSSFSLVTVPLFVLMGEIFFHTGIATRVFDVLDKIMGRVKGRLAYLTIGGGTLFATLSGSSMANTAMLGATLLPEMKRRGYKDHLALGPIVACGGLAAIIPPSSLAVLLGSLARLDIGGLLIAAIIPGIILAVLYVFVVFVSVRIDPEAAPSYAHEKVSLPRSLLLIVANLLPMGIVVFMVIGLILLGVATPTESAAFGVLGVLIVSAMFRALTWTALKRALLNSVKVSGMVFLIIMASSTFSQLLALSGASAGLIRWSTSLDVAPIVVILVMLLVLLFLGMLMESVSIMMLTIPIFFPLAQVFGFDLIWFAILMLIALEMSLATPPFGLCLFVLLGVAPRGTTLWQVSLAALPYVLCTLLLIGLIIIYPDLTSILAPSR